MQDEVRGILLEYWDPLGIGEVPAAHDEYDEYVRALVAWLERGPVLFAEVRQYLDDAAYALSPTFDDDARLDRTARMLVALTVDRDS